MYVVKVYLLLVFIFGLYGEERLASHIGSLPPGWSARYLLSRKLGGPQTQFLYVGEKFPALNWS
jgi:hypothetical protein